MSDAALVIIARAPEAGRVKTRLAAGIGAAAALMVYGQLLAVADRARRDWRGPVLLASDGDEQAWTGTPLADVPRRSQPAGGLGGRIAAALHWGLSTAPRVAAIGTDCPGLRPHHLRRLVDLLATVPIALGPAEDGGYWGIACGDATAIPVCTGEDLPWSRPDLLTTTAARLAAAGHALARGDVLADCDDADDLAVAVHAGHLTWPIPVEGHR